jgi:hypothetical protein
LAKDVAILQVEIIITEREAADAGMGLDPPSALALGGVGIERLLVVEDENLQAAGEKNRPAQRSGRRWIGDGSRRNGGRFFIRC